MTQSEEVLKACPWCRTTEHLSVIAAGSMTGDMPARPYRVMCHHLGHDDIAGPVAFGRLEAISAWNSSDTASASHEFSYWFEIVRDWSGSAFLSGEPVEDELSLKSALYSDLCRLGNYLTSWGEPDPSELSRLRPRVAELEGERDGWKRLADQRLEPVRNAYDLAHATKYLFDPDFLDRMAEKIDCGGQCDTAWREWDTNATGCTKSESEDGCPFDDAATLRDIAKAIRLQAWTLAFPETALSTATSEVERLRAGLGEGDLRRALIEVVTFEHSYREDYDRHPRDFWHVRACIGDLCTDWLRYGKQERSQQIEVEVVAAESEALAYLMQEFSPVFAALTGGAK